VTSVDRTTHAAKQRYSRPLVNVLRAGRTFAYLLLTPFDYLCRLINGKADIPPLHLRRHVGPLRSFEASGAEFMSYLQVLVGLQPSERVLDVGCGCGLMALYLKDYLDKQGSYVGIDLHGPSINWCRRHIGSEHRNFEFEHIDVQSLAYNPRGEVKGESFSFPYDSDSFDVVLLKSVFTHMRPAEVDNYLKEVARMLKGNGRCLATFFLLNQQQRNPAKEDRDALKFSFGTEEWRYVYEHSPESASAYDEGYILKLLEKRGLKLSAPIYYGQWTGRKEGLSFQDMLVMERVVGQ
jgi:ubiquinone/menaquinone biosynthesis C-methylase UbiE